MCLVLDCLLISVKIILWSLFSCFFDYLILSKRKCKPSRILFRFLFINNSFSFKSSKTKDSFWSLQRKKMIKLLSKSMKSFLYKGKLMEIFLLRTFLYNRPNIIQNIKRWYETYYSFMSFIDYFKPEQSLPDTKWTIIHRDY